MKAIVQEVYGAPHVLELSDVDQPVVTDDDVLVRVHAAAVNPDDWHITRGRPYIARMAFGLLKPREKVGDRKWQGNKRLQPSWQVIDQLGLGFCP